MDFWFPEYIHITESGYREYMVEIDLLEVECAIQSEAFDLLSLESSYSIAGALPSELED